MTATEPLAAHHLDAAGAAPAAGVGADLSRPPDGPRRRSVLRRFARDRMAVAGLVALVLVVGVLVAAPWVAPADPLEIDPPNSLASPSPGHPLGTDMLGRDEASRLLHGGRSTVLMALAATAGITLLGLVLGVTSGMLGGIVDAVVMRVVEVVQAVPLLLVALVAIGVLGAGGAKLVAVFIVLGWPGYARVVRGSTLSLRERLYVDAARALGASRLRIMARHVVPNLLGPLMVLTTLDLGRILLGLSALSFLGFGLQPPAPEWGRMIADARNYFYLAPELLMYPGIAISLVVLAVNLCGDGLRDALDVKLSRPRGEARPSCSCWWSPGWPPEPGSGSEATTAGTRPRSGPRSRRRWWTPTTTATGRRSSTPPRPEPAWSSRSRRGPSRAPTRPGRWSPRWAPAWPSCGGWRRPVSTSTSGRWWVPSRPPPAATRPGSRHSRSSTPAAG